MSLHRVDRKVEHSGDLFQGLVEHVLEDHHAARTSSAGTGVTGFGGPNQGTGVLGMGGGAYNGSGGIGVDGRGGNVFP
jgi:hypothetical protein